jgi:WD40 repeat protein
LASKTGGDEITLWPLPGNTAKDVRSLKVSEPGAVTGFEFDPLGRFLVLSGSPYDRIRILPLDGTPAQTLEGSTENNLAHGVAVSPSGRQIATAPARIGPWKIHVRDLETHQSRLFELPESSSSSTMGRARSVWSLAFADESTLYTSGDGGVYRWDLEVGSYESVFRTEPDFGTQMAVAANGRTALIAEVALEGFVEGRFGVLQLLDLESGQVQPLAAFDQGQHRFAIDATGTIVATGDHDGVVQVGRTSGSEPHLLLGHDGPVLSVVISPDGRWVASTGEDLTLRLWPMPDFDKPPLHTLPREVLIAKLESLTNLRAVRDETASTGWSIEIGTFPGWEEVPTW